MTAPAFLVDAGTLRDTLDGLPIARSVCVEFELEGAA